MTESTSRRPAYARLLDRAVRILAVRDHSEQELRRKLAAPIMGKMAQKRLMLRQKITSALLHGAMNMAISMTADLLRALSPAVAAKVMDLRVFARTESERYFPRSDRKKRCVNVTSTGAHWRAIRRRENMANLCQLSFQKKLRSSVFCSIVAI